MAHSLGIVGVTKGELMSESVKSLASKLAAVVLEVTRVEKRGHNEAHGYDYATAADMLEAVRTKLAERNIVIIPRVKGQSVIQKDRQGKTPMYIVTAEMILTVLDGDSGETLECPWLGCGEDVGDKGLYKALTGGYKYFLQELFMIPTGDDPEKSSRKRREAPGRASEPPAEVDPGSDAAVIATVATQIGLITGQHPDEVIREASAFTTKDGKLKSFTDPRKATDKWAKGVREKLERKLKSAVTTTITDDDVPF